MKIMRREKMKVIDFFLVYLLSLLTFMWASIIFQAFPYNIQLTMFAILTAVILIVIIMRGPLK